MIWPNISYDGRVLVFEHDFDIWKLDTSNNQATKVQIARHGAPAAADVEHVVMSEGITELQLSPDGRKIAFIARGEVFAASARETSSPINMHPATVTVEPVDERLLEQVRAVVEANLGNEAFNVEQLALEVAHSRGHLHRRLKDLLGESPSDLIRRMRLERAAQLLDAQAGTVVEVAYSVGFKSVAHFSNAFKDLYGIRPSGWRSRQTSVSVPPRP